MQRGFAAGANVAHEAFGYCARDGWVVGVCAVGQEDFEDAVIDDVVGLAEGCVEGGLAVLWVGVIDVGALLEEEFAETPVAVECGADEVEVVAERGEGGSLSEQEFDGAYVAVVGTVL